MKDFQASLLALQSYWAELGYTILQPMDTYVGAGTSHPATFFGALDGGPKRVAYVQASRRPADGRYAESPLRLQHYYQFQVLVDPCPEAWRSLYLDSLTRAFALDLNQFDFRFFEDNWENPSLGASGLGWEVCINGLEVTQLTYFQRMGGWDCPGKPLEITYGVERLAMLAQGCRSIWDLVWTRRGPVPVTYADLFARSEREHSHYNFSHADVDQVWEALESAHKQAKALLSRSSPLIYPAYELGLRMGYCFNLLESRGAIGVGKRQQTLLEIRDLNHCIASAYLKQKRAQTD